MNTHELKGLVLLDFWANWCPPCRMLAPILDNVVKATNVTLYKIDLDDDADLPSLYKIQSIPTVIFLKDGKEVERLVGLKSEQDIVNLVKKYIN